MLPSAFSVYNTFPDRYDADPIVIYDITYSIPDKTSTHDSDTFSLHIIKRSQFMTVTRADFMKSLDIGALS